MAQLLRKKQEKTLWAWYQCTTPHVLFKDSVVASGEDPDGANLFVIMIEFLKEGFEEEKISNWQIPIMQRVKDLYSCPIEIIKAA